MSKQGYTTIDSVVRSYMADKGYSTLHRYIYFLHWALKGLKEWNIDGGQEVKTKVLRLDPLKRIEFPDDYVNWVKLGRKVGDRIEAFVNDSSLTSNVDDCDTPNKAYVPSSQQYQYTFLNCEDTENRGDLTGFGYGHNGNGYFKVDNDARRFIFSAEVSQATIILEYISNGFKPGCKSLVSELVTNQIGEYINWCQARYELGDAAAETRARKLELQYEQLNVLGRTSDLSIEGILNATTRNSTYTMK